MGSKSGAGARAEAVAGVERGVAAADRRLNQVQLGRVVRPAHVRGWSGECLTRIYAHEHIPWGNAREKADSEPV